MSHDYTSCIHKSIHRTINNSTLTFKSLDQLCIAYIYKNITHSMHHMHSSINSTTQTLTDEIFTSCIATFNLTFLQNYEPSLVLSNTTTGKAVTVTEHVKKDSSYNNRSTHIICLPITYSIHCLGFSHH